VGSGNPNAAAQKEGRVMDLCFCCPCCARTWEGVRKLSTQPGIVTCPFCGFEFKPDPTNTIHLEPQKLPQN
jgi:hypothetical protein